MRSKALKGKAGARKSDLSADPVSEFYTRHPYPPPVESLDRLRDAWQAENPNRAEYHLIWPDKEYRSDLDVLVAGCGTWQATKYALCHPDARVVGIDVSPTSLEHTDTLKRKYNLTNLVTRRLPIENVAKLDKRFDLIVCTGVLHHLADPDAGLRALRSVLRPEGAMYLMVYAPYGRSRLLTLCSYFPIRSRARILCLVGSIFTLILSGRLSESSHPNANLCKCLTSDLPPRP